MTRMTAGRAPARCRSAVLALTGLLSATGLAASPACADPAKGSVFGFVDATGTFQASAVPPAASPSALSTATGKIALTLNITIASDAAHMPRTNPIRCGLYASITSMVSADDLGITESDWVTSPISSSRATCRLVIPYSWELAARAGDRVSISYIVSSQSDLVTPSPLTAAAGRSAERRIGTFAIPANGGSIAITKNVTL